MARIEEFWGLEHGLCARCGQPARCERAHIVDRCEGGLDGPQNLIPLCYPCHATMPRYTAGSEGRALLWLTQPYDEYVAEVVRRGEEARPDLFAAAAGGGDDAVEAFLEAVPCVDVYEELVAVRSLCRWLAAA